MPNNYVPQPIRIHEVMGHQHFRLCEDPYENPYVRTGTALALPNILIRRLTTGGSFGVQLHRVESRDAEGFNMGTIANPGFANIQLDDPINAYEMATFDRGNWVMPADVPDGLYYLKFFSGFFNWWSDEFQITAAGTTAGYPPKCDTHDWVKFRFRQPRCGSAGESLVWEDDKITDRTPILAYPEGMDFFCFLKAGALIESEWEPDTTEGPELASGAKKVNKLRMVKRWNLQGAPVSEAIIDSMQASAFFDIVEIFFPGLTDPLYTADDIVVDVSSPDKGCLYDFSYKFTASSSAAGYSKTGYLLKQGCC